jgi:hypothetical protein
MFPDDMPARRSTYEPTRLAYMTPLAGNWTSAADIAI